jgi:hydroxyacylglutathione hydrolase
MVFRQFVDEDLGCGSYIIGDAEAGEAVVIDPAFAIEQYLASAAELGVRIVRVLETHTHADHLSGHGRFALEHGVPVSIHPEAQPVYPFDPLEDGQVLRMGSVEFRVVHTPGHRPEHCSFVVDEELVLTGDSLFVGDAARPDLAIDAHEGAADLFRSLHRLAGLPDGVAVYPGHVAGSLCGSHMSPERSTSIGREKATNHALLVTELEAFVDESASLSTPRPPTTERLVTLNRGPWVGARASLEPAEDDDGALVLDVRPVGLFAAGHAPGAISVALDGGSFSTRSAFVVDPSERLVLHARSAVEAKEAARQLWAVGLFNAVGFRAGADPTETLATITVPELARLLEDGWLQVLDVREEAERQTVLPGSRAIPYRSLRNLKPGTLDPVRPVYTICESGQRATLAASVLNRQGYDARAVVSGGVGDLERANAESITTP